jgi:hypothetical protein
MAGWGDERYGIDPWGVGGDEAASVFGVSPGVVELRGGSTISVVGTGFVEPIELIITHGSAGSLVEIGRGFMWDPKYDLTPTTAKFGLPSSDFAGSHNIELIVAGVSTGVIFDVLEYTLHCERHKLHKVRSSWAKPWRVGPRIFPVAVSGGLD